MCKIAIYPGSFDPVTYGHIDIIKRALNIFEEVIVAVAHNPHKKSLFSVKERVDMLKKATQKIDGARVEDFHGLVIDFAKKKNIDVIIRGLRMISDFEYEFQMALTNRKLKSQIETIFLMPSEEYSYISSKLIKEAAALGADISCFVPGFVKGALIKKINKVINK